MAAQRLQHRRFLGRIIAGSIVLNLLLPTMAIAQDIPISGVIGEESSSSSSSTSLGTPIAPVSHSSSKSRSRSRSSAQSPTSASSQSAGAKSSKHAAKSSSSESSTSSSAKSKRASSSSKSETVVKQSSVSSEKPIDESDIITFTLRPHCDSEDQNDCPGYHVLSPTTIDTPTLSIGDTLDMDLIALNPGNLPLKKVRAWVVYDPSVFTGESIVFDSVYEENVTEQEFDVENGYVKIEAMANGASSEDTVLIARLTFTVAHSDSSGKSIIGFDDQGDDIPHTYVYRNESSTQNVVSQNLGVLAVNLSTEDVLAQDKLDASEDADTPLSGSGSRTVFVLLQPQNVQITTEGDSVYVSWDALPSYELVGYNVYYSTVSGRYIQRRTVAPDVNGIALQSLPKGTTYFVAVRGVNAGNEETAFSQEVGIKVGVPTSSTSPFLAKSAAVPAPANPLENTHRAAGDAVPGESGLSTLLLLAIIASAVAGTFIAVRRQRGLAFRTVT